jgi:hypothetical protein
MPRLPLPMRIPGSKASAGPGVTERPTRAGVAQGLERVARLMDRSFTIPGTRIKFGLDALIGLLPVGGDAIAGLIQAGLVLVALYHYRVPKHVAVRMAANVLLDTAVGAIPLVGDAFDVFFKANTRNIRLLERYAQAPTQQPRTAEAASPVVPAGKPATPWKALLPLALALAVALVLMLVGAVALLVWLVPSLGRIPLF